MMLMMMKDWKLWPGRIWKIFKLIRIFKLNNPKILKLSYILDNRYCEYCECSQFAVLTDERYYVAAAPVVPEVPVLRPGGVVGLRAFPPVGELPGGSIRLTLVTLTVCRSTNSTNLDSIV